MSSVKLTLFFTRNISLNIWDKVGMFEREVSLYRKLQSYGVKINFVTFGDARDLQYSDYLPGIKILCNRWRLPGKIYQRLLPLIYGYWFRQSDVIKTNQIDGADIALRTARLWRKPLIARGGYMWSEFVAQDQGEDSDAAKFSREIERRVFSFAQKIVVTTPAMAQKIAQRVLQSAPRITVIPNYVDTEVFTPKVNGDRDLDIIFIGRFSPQKNIASLLEAVQPLDVRVMLIGSGELKDELLQRFANMDSRLYWEDNIPNVELPQYLNRALIFVLPSHYEGHPKTLIEAMACGLPVIGADSPGIRELIHHGQNGWLCGTDANSIRTAIKELLAQSHLRTKLGQNARKFVIENYALDRVIDMELTLLKEVVR